MQRFVIQKLDDAAAAPRSIPGGRCTVTLPELPDHVRSPQDLLRYLTSRPETIADVINNLFPLVDEPDYATDHPKNPDPPR